MARRASLPRLYHPGLLPCTRQQKRDDSAVDHAFGCRADFFAWYQVFTAAYQQYASQPADHTPASHAISSGQSVEMNSAVKVDEDDDDDLDDDEDFGDFDDEDDDEDDEDDDELEGEDDGGDHGSHKTTQ